jgi:hypothetical protein
VSVDTIFQPKTATVAVDNTAAVSIPGAKSVGVTTFRIVALVASGHLAWGPPNKPPAAATAPAIGTPVMNTVLVLLNVPLYLEVPPDSVFIGGAAFAAGGFEITGGQGGIGG